MLAEDDIPIDDAGPEGPAEAPEPPAVVVVVPRRRSRGRRLAALLPPALILAAALAILSYRLLSPDWRGLNPGVAPRAVATEPPPPTQRATGPVIVRLDARPALPPEPPPEPAGPPKLPPAPPRPEPAAIGFLAPAEGEGEGEGKPPAAPPAAANPFAQSGGLGPVASNAPATPRPPDPSPAEAERAWEEIRRESERLKADSQDLAYLKRQAGEIARREAQQREARQAARAKADADAQRREFRSELKRTVDELGNRAAPRIRALCQRFQHTTTPEIERDLALSFRNVSGTDLVGRIDLARLHGLPEPMVLMLVNKYEILSIAARDGPRSTDEALVRAARVVLAVPPLTPRAAAAHAAATARRTARPR